MDRFYLMDIIRRIKLERDQHDAKFAANHVHENCLPRFDTVIVNLEKELANIPDLRDAGSVGDLPA